MAINTLFENIADAIREASSSTEDYTPAEMPDAIRAISTSGGGDMYKADYDPDNIVDDAGGIVDYVAAQIAGKANSADVYTKTQTDSLLANKANSADVYTKTQTDGLLADKANSADVYTKTQTDGLLADKANSADVYTKTATDDLLDAKTNISTITDLFDANTSYAAGDYFIDNNIIYHVDVPCTGITPPNANYYTPNKLTDFIKENTSQISNNTIVRKGDRTLLRIGSPGYITGSGNYVNFFIPMTLDSSITSVSLTTSAGSWISIFNISGSYLSKEDIDWSYSDFDLDSLGVTIELKFNSTQTANTPVTVFFGSVILTFA